MNRFVRKCGTAYWFVFMLGLTGYLNPGRCQAQQPTTARSYVATTTVNAKEKKTDADVNALTVDQALRTIQYYDGLGRPIQTVHYQQSPDRKDLVQPVTYDPAGREVKKYLPYVSNGTADGSYRSNALGSTGIFSFYNPVNGYAGATVEKTNYPYSALIYENSDRNEVLKVGAPGEEWQPKHSEQDDHSIKTEETTNGNSEVMLLEYNAETLQFELSASGYYYSPGQLHGSVTLDEHNHKVIVYVDNEGRTLLKKVETVDENGATTYAETYYVYDDFGNLVVVLPPEATKRIKTLLLQP